MTEAEFDRHPEQFRSLARFLERAATGGLMLTFSLYGLAALVLFAGHAIMAAITATCGLLLFRIQWPAIFALTLWRFAHRSGFEPALACLRRDRERLGVRGLIRELGGHTRRRPSRDRD